MKKMIITLTCFSFIFGSSLAQEFTRLAPTTEDPNGNTALANCGDYPDAKATLDVVNSGLSSDVTITLENAKPNTLFTAWLRLQGKDAAGNDFGRSPLTGAGSTPLAPSTALADLYAATGAGNGMVDVANGIMTDENGNGVLKVMTDFPFTGGVYPFHNFTDFDPGDGRLPIDNPKAIPVAIVMPNATISAPFGVRLASHCTDNLGHGLTAGAREPWFDFPE